MERLQKILSQAGVASRRASEQLMLDGRVTVNGVTVRELGSKADPSSDDIRVDGRRVKVVEHHRYLLLNKPRGYVTTRSDPQRRPTVIELLAGVREYVYPVGRPFMYATTNEFLIRFGLNDLSDLPKVEDMAEALGLEAPILVEQTPREEELPLNEPDVEEHAEIHN